MRPHLRALFSSELESDSWFTRIRENFRQLFTSVALSPTSANGAPIHLLKFDRTRRVGRAQGFSAFAHLLFFAALVFIATHPNPRNHNALIGGVPKVHTVPAFPSGLLAHLGIHPNNGSGRSGDRNPIPAKSGNLPSISSLQLVRPSLHQNQHSDLPVPPTILDMNAPAVLITVGNIGLPWMPKDTNSPGPGSGHGIGSADGPTMGDSGSGPTGYGESGGLYAPGVISPSCVQCPYPVYTDEARHVKVQGTVTLRVLVGADGRASDIRVVRGVGYGLEERAVQTIRGWKFSPAQDAKHRAVAAWVTIEAIFHLF